MWCTKFDIDVFTRCEFRVTTAGVTSLIFFFVAIKNDNYKNIMSSFGFISFLNRLINHIIDTIIWLISSFLDTDGDSDQFFL